MIELSTPNDDGLIMPEVGVWSRDKHHFLARYIDAFRTAMKGKRWSGLHYIDLFAGAGIERIRGKSELEWGSPLIAAQINNQFTKLHLCESDKEKQNALAHRLQALRPTHDDQVLRGDANLLVPEIVSAIPQRSLSLAFLDPYGLHLDYDTLTCLAGVRADLIIFFPDRIDALRNWRAYYWDNPDSKLDTVLGPGSNWRELLRNAPESQKVKRLLDEYVCQIPKLGYTEFEWEPIPSSGARLYWLLFCSKANVATRIWRGTSARKRDGQRTWDFG